MFAQKMSEKCLVMVAGRMRFLGGARELEGWHAMMLTPGVPTVQRGRSGSAGSIGCTGSRQDDAATCQAQMAHDAWWSCVVPDMEFWQWVLQASGAT
jgi:hypothetical protein